MKGRIDELLERYSSYEESSPLDDFSKRFKAELEEQKAKLDAIDEDNFYTFEEIENKKSYLID